jgi:hypothetical protein
MGQWFQRFVASGLRGEVSDATIQGYLRSASQLEDIWQQIDDNVDALIAQGVPPWDAYARMGCALAYVRACRTNVVLVQELVKAVATAEPASTGYLPKITFDQALALCEHIEPYLEEAIKASTSSRYVPTTYPLPLALGPHILYANQRFPLPHLQGIIGAAQQARDWAAGLLAKYELALEATKIPVPQSVSTHVEEMKSELGLGDFHLRTGIDMVGQMNKEQTTGELSDKAEGFLWEAMESFFKVSQLVAFPGRPMPVPPPRNVEGGISHEQPYQRPAGPGSGPAMPAPPTPVRSDLLTQVISAPGAIEKTPVPPIPDISSLLNEITADRGASQPAPVSPSPDMSDMLNALTNNTRTTEGASPPSVTKRPDAQAHAPQPGKPTSEDNVLDLLSEITGEPKNDE